MTTDRFRFDRFVLDTRDRRLSRDDAPVELNARYFDALALLVGEAGRLVSKDRFMAEVWRGVPVTDEALTQCVRTLRRQLGDDAAAPRFIETVPKHGYRFVAPVEIADAAPGRQDAAGWPRYALLAVAGTGGGGVAGLVGGLLYGFAGAAPGIGAASVLVVLVCVTTVVAALGAAGVAGGIAIAGFVARRPWGGSILGGAAGGLVTGAIAKLVGLDAFALLIGRSPGDVTGAAEGVLLGGAVGLGGWLAAHAPPHWPVRARIALAALTGALGGAAIPLAGLRMMGGSLDLLARGFPGSRLRFDRIGALFGEAGFGPVSQAVSGAIEGALFAGFVFAAMRWADDRTRSRSITSPDGMGRQAGEKT